MLTKHQVAELKREVGIEEPNDTCPIIDEGIEALKAAEEHFERARRANENLREWGGNWRDKAMELQERVNTLKAEVADLKSTCESLEEELAGASL